MIKPKWMLACKRIILLLYLFVFCVEGISAQDLPSDRIIDWSIAGLDKDFIFPRAQVNVMDFGATGLGLSNDALAIQAAINSFGGKAGVVFIPAGTYLMNNAISLADSIILAGSGSDSTILNFDLGGVATNCINISGGTSTSFQPLIAGYSEGSDRLVPTSANSYEVGDCVEIHQDNGDWDTNPISWANYSVGQMLKVIGVHQDTLILKNPLRISYDADLNPQIRKISARTNAGIQCFGINRLDEPAEGAGSNINLSYAYNCRIAGVESDHSVGAHINLHFCTNIEVSGCYFHDAFTYDGSGTRGYGVCMSMHTGECLVRNNIFKHLRHAMMVKTGSNGNVFSYNYSIEPHRSETINDFSGDISLHGHYAYFNLFEGNICQNIIIDHYWGPSGPGNTFLRNRAEWYGLIMTDDNGVTTDRQNFLANEISENGFNFVIQLWYGLYYVLTGSDHFEWGNNSDGEIIPSGTQVTNLNSLYLDFAPEFWDIPQQWPSVGYPNTLNQGSIPARERYNASGIKTVCPAITVNQTLTLKAGWSGISSFVNPYPKNIQSLFQGISDKLDILYNDNGVFIPDQSINTLQDWDWQQAYVVKVSQDCELEFNGSDCSGAYIPLNEGWNLFPVLSPNFLIADSLVEQYPGQILVIKEIAGNKVWWPAQEVTTLKYLNSGGAYFINYGLDPSE